MIFTTKYPLRLRFEVVEAYHNHVGGYKKLAKIYGLNRDLVRFWVLDRKRKKPLGIDELISMSEELAMKKVSKDPVVKKELQDLQLQVAFYKKLSEILEAENKDVKKKHVAEQFKFLHQKDIL